MNIASPASRTADGFIGHGMPLSQLDPSRRDNFLPRGYTLATRVAGSDQGPVSLPRMGRTVIQYCWPGVRPLMTYSEAVEVAEPTSCVSVALENHLIS